MSVDGAERVWGGGGRGADADAAAVVADSKLIKMFVLDEADEMLSRGFKDQIYEIFQKLSTNIQVSVLVLARWLRPLPHEQKSAITVWSRRSVPYVDASRRLAGRR